MMNAVPLAGDLGVGGRGMGLVIVSAVLTTISLLFVILRIVSRMTFKRARLGRDDLAIVCSVVFSLTMGIVNCIAVARGFGRASMTLSPKELRLALTLFWILQILYKFTINLTKISIGLLYMRIFPDKNFHHWVWAIIAFVGCYAIASIAATILECTPIVRVWDKSVAGRCINFTAFWYTNGSVNIATDLILWFLPHRMIRKLNMPRQQKIWLMGLFLLGVFVVVMSIVRMTALNPASKANDTTFGTLKSTIWTTVEANVGIWCACGPTLRGPIAALFPHVFSRSARSGSNEWPGARDARGSSTQPASSQVQETLGGSGSRRGRGRTLPYASSNVTRASTRTFGSQEAIINFGKDEEDSTISTPLNTISKKTDVDIEFGDRTSMPTANEHMRAVFPSTYPAKALVPH